jgi:hypothetical protein
LANTQSGPALCHCLSWRFPIRVKRVQLESRFSLALHAIEANNRHIFNNENDWAGDFSFRWEGNMQVSVWVRCSIYANFMPEPLKQQVVDKVKTGFA